MVKKLFEVYVTYGKGDGDKVANCIQNIPLSSYKLRGENINR